MPTVEEQEERLSRLETLYEEVIKERLIYISQRVDQIYEKTERDKTEILTKTEKDKTDILAIIESLKTDLLTKTESYKTDTLAKTEKNKTEILAIIESLKTDLLTKTEKDKRELILWMSGLFVGFSTLMITAIWAILTFAFKK